MTEFTCHKDNTLSKILVKINENASSKFLVKNQTTYSLNYLKYIDIKNNYKNKALQTYILYCLINCLHIPTINFTDNGQYLYIYLTDLKDPFDKNKIIIKIGFTTNLERRQKELKRDYKDCNFYLLGFRKINGIFDENKFHNHIKNKYNNLYIKLKNEKLNSFTKETYFLHPLIMAEAVDYIVNLPNQLEIQQEITKQIEIQEKTKQMELELKEKTKQMELELNEKTKQMELELNEKTKQMELELKEKTKQMELELKEKTKQMKLQIIQLELQNKQMELQIKQLELQNKQMELQIKQLEIKPDSI